MSEPNAMELTARRIEQGCATIDDIAAVMALLGYETGRHARIGIACRPAGEGRWQSRPSFWNAHDAELWLRTEKSGGRFDDMGQDEDGSWYASFLSAEHGNDYGNSDNLGCAMFAAFARSVGQADNGE